MKATQINKAVKFIRDCYVKSNKRIISQRAFDEFLNIIFPQQIKDIEEQKIFDKRINVSKNISLIIYEKTMTLEVFFIDEDFEDSITIKRDNNKMETFTEENNLKETKDKLFNMFKVYECSLYSDKFVILTNEDLYYLDDELRSTLECMSEYVQTEDNYNVYSLGYSI